MSLSFDKINLNINLSKLDKNRLFTADNGNKYCRLDIVELREPDEHGNTVTVYMAQNAEERQSSTPKVYVGRGKTYTFTPQADPQPAQQPQQKVYVGQSNAQPQQPAPVVKPDDLPF